MDDVEVKIAQLVAEAASQRTSLEAHGAELRRLETAGREWESRCASLQQRAAALNAASTLVAADTAQRRNALERHKDQISALTDLLGGMAQLDRSIRRLQGTHDERPDEPMSAAPGTKFIASERCHDEAPSDCAKQRQPGGDTDVAALVDLWARTPTGMALLAEWVNAAATLHAAIEATGMAPPKCFNLFTASPSTAFDTASKAAQPPHSSAKPLEQRGPPRSLVTELQRAVLASMPYVESSLGNSRTHAQSSTQMLFGQELAEFLTQVGSYCDHLSMQLENSK